MIVMQNTRAFTLIELLVVITVFIFLTTSVMVSFDGAKQKSRDAKRLSDIKSLMNALDLYLNTQKTYPAGVGGLPGDVGGTCLSQPLNNMGFAVNCSGQEFMKTVPKSPLGAKNSVCALADNIYHYEPIGTPDNYTSYLITFCLETDSIKGLSSGVHKIGPAGFQ